MRIVDIDGKAAKEFEPIKFIIDGKEYVVESVSSDIMERIGAAGANASAITEVFGEMLGMKPSDVKKLDFRKLLSVISAINDMMRKDIEAITGKNIQGEGAAMNPSSTLPSPEGSPGKS